MHPSGTKILFWAQFINNEDIWLPLYDKKSQITNISLVRNVKNGLFMEIQLQILRGI